MTFRISVVIPTYNYERFVGQAIDAVLAESLGVDEVIVVDDGSVDETAAEVAKFGDKVRYIKQDNAGVSAARNSGVSISTGEFIAFLDADDTWAPTKLENQLALFESDPEIGLVHCGMREFDSDKGETLGVMVEGRSGWVADDLLLWEGPSVNVSGSSIMVSREAFDAAGGFDTRIKVGEDWDLCYRIARKYKVGFVPEPLLNYRVHSGGAHHNVENMERGMGLFYEKAFDTTDEHILSLRPRAMSNYHRVLSGSYFRGGDYKRFLVNAGKSIAYRPAAISYFFKFPFRKLRNS